MRLLRKAVVRLHLELNEEQTSRANELLDLLNQRRETYSYAKIFMLGVERLLGRLQGKHPGRPKKVETLVAGQ
jgi:hypothetical protein